MITFNLPPTPENTHLVSADFNLFLDNTVNDPFAARLAGQAIASTLLSNGARIEELDAIADKLIIEHDGEGARRSMLIWPGLSGSFKQGFEIVIGARHKEQGVTV